MAILTSKKVWRRERTKPRLYAQLAALTPAEQANVLAFAKKLRARASSWEALARRAGVQRLTLFRACTGIQPPCAGLALRLARLAKVPVEDVLSGVFAKAGALFDAREAADCIMENGHKAGALSKTKEVDFRSAFN